MATLYDLLRSGKLIGRDVVIPKEDVLIRGPIGRIAFEKSGFVRITPKWLAVRHKGDEHQGNWVNTPVFDIGSVLELNETYAPDEAITLPLRKVRIDARILPEGHNLPCPANVSLGSSEQ